MGDFHETYVIHSLIKFLLILYGTEEGLSNKLLTKIVKVNNVTNDGSIFTGISSHNYTSRQQKSFPQHLLSWARHQDLKYRVTLAIVRNLIP